MPGRAAGSQPDAPLPVNDVGPQADGSPSFCAVKRRRGVIASIEAGRGESADGLAERRANVAQLAQTARRNTSSAIRSSGSTFSTPPSLIASAGMPNTTHDASSWAIV